MVTRGYVRAQAIEAFASRKKPLMVATDLLARGYDQQSVNLVVNVDMPIVFETKEMDCETYLHRTGRAGRQGTEGIGVSLLSGEADLKLLQVVGP